MIVVCINSTKEHKLDTYILTNLYNYYAGWYWVQPSVRSGRPHNRYLLLGAGKSREILITTVCITWYFFASEGLSSSTCGFRVSSFCQLYFVIPRLRKLTSNMSPFTLSIPSPLLGCPATPFLPIASFSISEWATTLFLLILGSWWLVKFLLVAANNIFLVGAIKKIINLIAIRIT